MRRSRPSALALVVVSIMVRPVPSRGIVDPEAPAVKRAAGSELEQRRLHRRAGGAALAGLPVRAPALPAQPRRGPLRRGWGAEPPSGLLPALLVSDPFALLDDEQ